MSIKRKHELYKTYESMLSRCYKISNPRYERYSSKGITVCDRWLGPNGFWIFVRDMGDKPSRRYSLDRIDNDKGYSPDNCRWATMHQQQANRGNNTDFVGVTYNRFDKKWYAQLQVEGKIYKKSFLDKGSAMKYRKLLEQKYL
jgi:hypothetical protein